MNESIRHFAGFFSHEFFNGAFRLVFKTGKDRAKVAGTFRPAEPHPFISFSRLLSSRRNGLPDLGLLRLGRITVIAVTNNCAMIFDTRTIAKHLNTTQETVSRWCKAGTINARKVG